MISAPTLLAVVVISLVVCLVVCLVLGLVLCCVVLIIGIICVVVLIILLCHCFSPFKVYKYSVFCYNDFILKERRKIYESLSS